MKRKVAGFIAKHRLLDPSGLHLVALSGGPDSVALLRVLIALGYRVEAAHCNFHLRGAESDRDEAFVKHLCESFNVPLHLIHFDTDEYARLHQVSIEMAARELRYGYFERLCQDIGASTVCVAHHRDDAVETFLMNLLRGSGIHGLTGIRPRNGIVVRPLLGVSRQEVLEYLDSIAQDYVTDSTNLESIVLRNKLRLQVIPLLQQLNPKAVENIDKTASYLREAEKVYDAFMQNAVNSASSASQTISADEILRQPSPESFLFEWLSPHGFNASQIERILAALMGEPGREFLSPSHVLLIDRRTLVLEPVSEPVKPLRVPESGNYRFNGEKLFSFKESEEVSISKSADCATLDAANIQYPLTIRLVQEGDAFCPLGMEGRKLVSDYLTDRKLSLLEKRRTLVVVNANGDILWLVGHRPDHRYRVTPETTRVLSITLSEKS